LKHENKGNNEGKKTQRWHIYDYIVSDCLTSTSFICRKDKLVVHRCIILG